MSPSLDSTKKKVAFLPCKIIKMKLETLVMVFFLLQTMLFSVPIREGGQISNPTGAFA